MPTDDDGFTSGAGAGRGPGSSDGIGAGTGETVDTGGGDTDTGTGTGTDTGTDSDRPGGDDDDSGFVAPDRDRLADGAPATGATGDAGPDPADTPTDRLSDPAAPGAGDRPGDGQTSAPQDTDPTPEQPDNQFDPEAGLEDQRGFAAESPTGEAVNELQREIARETPGVEAGDTEAFNIVRAGEDGDRLTAEFAPDTEERIAERRVEQALAADEPQSERQAEIQTQAEQLREEVAAGTTDVSPGDVQLRVEDGQLVADPGVAAMTEAEAAAGTRTDVVRAREPQAEEAALSDRFQRSQQTEITFDESALATRFEARDTAAAELRADREEKFGDTAVPSPISDRRLEEDLQAAGEETRQLFGAAAEASSRGAPAAGPFGALAGVRSAEQTAFRVGDALGLDTPTPGQEGELERLAERAATSAADAFNPFSAAAEAKEIGEVAFSGTLDEDDPTQAERAGETVAATDIETSQPVAGATPVVTDVDLSGARETEFSQDVSERVSAVARTTERSFREDPAGATAAAAGGLAGAAVAGTGIGRVVSRVPGVSGSDLSGRVLRAGGRAVSRGSAGARRFAAARRGQASLTGPDIDIGDADDAVITRDDLADARFTEPVRVARVRRARERGRRQAREAETTPPDELLRAEDVERDVLRDEDIEADIERADLDASATTGPSISQREAFRSSLFGESDDLGLSPRESQLAASLETPDSDLRDVAEAVVGRDAEAGVLPRAGAVQQAAGGAGVFVGGLLGGGESRTAGEEVFDSLPTAVDGDAATEPRIDSDAATDVFQDFRADVSGRVDSRADARPLAGLTADERQDITEPITPRLDSRQDTRADTRADLRQDLRFDIREDVRQDVRTDVRADLRQDTRLDTPDAREDDDDEEPPVDGFGIRAREFVNPIETAETFLGGDGGDR